MKKKVMFTIDEELCNWLEKKENKSDFINSLIFEAKISSQGLMNKIKENQQRIFQIEEENIKYTEKIKSQLIEGNKKEREEAQKNLDILEKERKNIRQKQEEKAQFWKQLIIEKSPENPTKIFEELMELDLYDHEVLISYSIKFEEQEILKEIRGPEGIWKRKIDVKELRYLINFLKREKEEKEKCLIQENEEKKD